MEFLGDRIGPWELFGFLGNLCFGARFFVQWIASERAKKSVMPISFWYLSIAGSLILLVYFIHVRKIVGILAFLPNLVPYSRNLVLTLRQRHAPPASVCPP